MLLRVGFQKETGLQKETGRTLGEVIDRINDVIAVVEEDKPKLLVIVDGLDRKEFSIALNIFSSLLLTDLNCHIVYTIPIALRYSSLFKQSMEHFTDRLDLDNIAVFKCDKAVRPTSDADRLGRHILASVIQKRLLLLGKSYENLFEPQALNLLCEKSGGVMRDLVRLARKACELALVQKVEKITYDIALEAIEHERRTYTIEDYHYPELAIVRQTGKLTNNTFDSLKRGKVVICNELLHYKLILGYQDPKRGRWFDVNPVLWADVERWCEDSKFRSIYR
jgi:hypothetical protein